MIWNVRGGPLESMLRDGVRGPEMVWEWGGEEEGVWSGGVRISGVVDGLEGGGCGGRGRDVGGDEVVGGWDVGVDGRGVGVGGGWRLNQSVYIIRNRTGKCDLSSRLDLAYNPIPRSCKWGWIFGVSMGKCAWSNRATFIGTVESVATVEIGFSTKRNVEAHKELTWDNKIDFEDKEHPIKVRTTSQVWWNRSVEFVIVKVKEM
ncbi:hypothetical protein Tco_0480744 [Tanacetum coccineum]